MGAVRTDRGDRQRAIRARCYWHVDGTAAGSLELSTGQRRPKSASDLLKQLERATGIEPAFSAWEADVLPLNYTRVCHCNLPKVLLTAPSGLSLGPSRRAREPALTSG
jgi:hypothetical protein